MADPLTQATNQLAPAPASTNYFDPEPGRNVISRYGQSRALGESLQGALRLSGLARSERLGQIREPVVAMEANEYLGGAGLRERERNMAMNDLDQRELELQDEREARAARGQFVRELRNLDGTSPDFPATFRGIMEGAAPAVLEDPVVSGLLELAQDEFKETQMRNRYKEQEDLRRQRYRENSMRRVQEKAGGKGIPGEREKEIYEANIGADGVFDEVGYNMDLLSEAEKTERGAKVEAAKEIIDYRTKAGEVLRNQRDFEESAKRSARVDAEAFPRQLEALRESARETNWGKGLALKTLDEQIEANWPDEFAQAVRWDKDPYENEFEAARDTPRDEYVNFYPDLPEDKKEKRDILWRAANPEGQESADQAVDAPRVDMPGFESEEEVAAANEAAPQPEFSETKTVEGITYGKIDGQWFIVED